METRKSFMYVKSFSSDCSCQVFYQITAQKDYVPVDLVTFTEEILNGNFEVNINLQWILFRGEKYM